MSVKTRIDQFLDQAEGRRISMAVDLDVVVGGDAAALGRRQNGRDFPQGTARRQSSARAEPARPYDDRRTHAERSPPPRRVDAGPRRRLPRLYLLDSIFAIFAGPNRGNPLYLLTGASRNRL